MLVRKIIAFGKFKANIVIDVYFIQIQYQSEIKLIARPLEYLCKMNTIKEIEFKSGLLFSKHNHDPYFKYFFLFLLYIDFCDICLKLTISIRIILIEIVHR